MRYLPKPSSGFIKLLLAATLGGGLSLAAAQWLVPERPLSISERQATDGAPVFAAAARANGLPDFREAASKSLPTVVHIRNTPTEAQRHHEPSFEDFFGGPGRGGGESSGSGVIITKDGYIVSNNHVVEGDGKISVTLFDNRTFEARLVGADPSTDLALLKIEATDLPFLPFGNSDQLVVGEWVLAVGNPFNLTSTVTAGIVSAKGRSIGILSDQYRIESFIQTDAAINPGNSGGALINTNGQLVGINTAIASRTGSYVGYGFAVPVTIVRKVVDDLKMYGEVQRAFLGVTIQDVNSELAREENLRVSRGVYINKVNPGSSAADAGLKAGDVIMKVNGVNVNTASELQEQIGQMRPGDEVAILYNREGQDRTANVRLRNRAGTTELGASSPDTRLLGSLGADLAPISQAEQATYKTDEGVRVSNLRNGLLRQAGIRDGFVITHIDRRPVASVEEVSRALGEGARQGVLISGVYPGGAKAYYAFGY